MDQARQPAALTYASYLKIDELLSLQQFRSDGPDGPEHDEMLFIVIHQVYELWFKQMLHELDGLRVALEANKHANASATLKRILTILKTLVGQIDILETMTPVSFLSFRDRLESASGFQSVGFREFEFVCGNKKRAMIDHHADNPAARDRLQKRYIGAITRLDLCHSVLAKTQPRCTATIQPLLEEPAELPSRGAFESGS